MTEPDKNKIREIIKEIQKANLNITKEGIIQDFLGINIKTATKGHIELAQLHLINHILSDMTYPQRNLYNHRCRKQ